MNPILKYPGAKWRIADWIIGHMPPHEGYLEPFFGSGAVLLNKAAARVETANDLDGLVVNFFRVVREAPEELARCIALTPWARDEYEASDDPTEDPVERARRFAVRCAMAFGSNYAHKSGWRHSIGAYAKRTQNTPHCKVWANIPYYVMLAAERLMEVQFENRPALEVIRKYNGPDMLIYADPPYPRSTRTLNGDQYRHEMTEAEHEALLAALKAHTGMALLSGYDCDLYRDNLPDWAMVTKDVAAERGAKRTECLWLNPAVVDANGRQVRMELEG